MALARIKKKQYEGFKDFVASMETTGTTQRFNIVVNGILEDPVFMQWVTRNLKNFNHFLELPSDDIEAVIHSNESMVTMLAKALKNRDWEKYSHNFSHFLGKLRDEIGYLSEVSAVEEEAAQFFLLKTTRKLQKEEVIHGFSWDLPPQDVFHSSPLPKEGLYQVKFLDGSIAAEGEVLKGKKIGPWKHFYEDHKLLAEGPYQEDLKSGHWVFYYGNGEKRAEGDFISDSRNGEWREWTRHGEMSISEWVEGKRQS